MNTTGIGLRSSHYSEFLRGRPQVPWLEAITENFLGIGGFPRRVLRSLRQDYPIALHGVGLSIGSTGPLHPEYLRSLKALVREVDPILVTDHLSWSRHGAENSFDLLPLAYTRSSLKRVIAKVNETQEYLGRQICLENPSAYVTSRANEFSESEFLAEVSRRTGCAILLDVNNLVVNSRNLGWDPAGYLRGLEGADVRQFHVAGHSKGSTLCIDTHDHPPDAETLALFQRARAYWPDARPLLEWDDKLPSLTQLISMANEIDTLAAQVESDSTPSVTGLRSLESILVSDVDEKDESLLEDFWRIVRDPAGVHEGFTDILKKYNNAIGDSRGGFHVYNSGYFARISEALGKLFPILCWATDDLWPDLVRDYLLHCSPTVISIDRAGEGLPGFLYERDLPYEFGVSQVAIADIAAFENARNQAYLAEDGDSLNWNSIRQMKPSQWEDLSLRPAKSVRLLRLGYNIIGLATAFKRNGQADPPEPIPTTVLVYRTEDGLCETFCPEPLASVIGADQSFRVADLISSGKMDAPAFLKFLWDHAAVFTTGDHQHG